MKKISILLALVLTVMVANAQVKQKVAPDFVRINMIEQMAAKASYQHRLTQIQSTDNYEDNNYYYDNTGRLIAVREYRQGEYEVIDSVYYNDQNQLVKLAGFQKMSATIWRNVYYIDYTYDQNGNLTSRTNYNFFGNEWNLGGVYTYYFNSNNQHIRTELVMADMLFQKIEFAYDGNNLVSELWYDYDGSGVTADYKRTYHYESGLLKHVDDSSSSDGGRSWQNGSRDVYTYDDHGNVTEFQSYNPNRLVTNRCVYTLDYDLQMSSTQIPWHPELEVRPKSYTNNNCIIFEEYWGLDTEGELQHICDYDYTYEGYTSIRHNERPAISLYPNPTQGRLVVEADQVLSTTVFNAMGQTVKTFGPASQLDLSDLPTGIYTLSVKTAHGTAVQQVVRQ